MDWTHEIATFVLEGKRLPIPEACPTVFRTLMESCWAQNPDQRPEFTTVLAVLGSSLGDPTAASPLLARRTVGESGLVPFDDVATIQ